jgi:transcriptional regulator of acetoin/glycerol metabolism
MSLLQAQPWPGNVRQLSNVLERAVILSDAESLGAPELKPLLRVGGTEQEEEELRQALSRTGGDKRAAAEILGVSYRTLQRRVKEHDLEGFPKYRS